MANDKKPDNLNVTKIEFKNKGKIKVTWNKGSVESAVTRDLPQHPDLQEAVQGVVPFMNQYFGDVSNGALSLKAVKMAYYEDKDGMSVQISCVHTHGKSAQNTTMNTAKMQVHEEHYGFETKLKKAINTLCEEAYQYAVNMKSSQLKVA